jgi:hypothetical protein
MIGVDCSPQYIASSFKNLAEYWRERWLIPRSNRVDGWHDWKSEELQNNLLISNK